MSHIVLDADSLANLMASVSDFTQVDITDGKVTATDPAANLTIGVSGLVGEIRITAGGVTFNVSAITVAKSQVKAEFSIGKNETDRGQ